MTDAPLPPARRTATPRYREAPKKKGIPIVAWIVLGAVVAVGGVWFFVMKAGEIRHRLPIDWPAAKGGGDAVPIAHKVKVGDVFESTATVRTGVVMGADHDPMAGMTFLATVRWTQTVAPDESGRLRSTYVVKMYGSDGTLPFIQGFVKTGLMGDKPLSFELTREASGKPVAGTGRLTPGSEDKRAALDYCLSGLSDLTSSYLPPREIREGEVWDLTDAANLGGLVEMMRFLATVTPLPAGFPKGKLDGRVGAETIETKDRERCVRLKLALEALCEGEVVAPARPGWISSVAKVEGQAWVSTTTGVLWALETVAEGRATYKKSNSQEERRVRQFVTVATKRVDPTATDPGK